MAQRLLVLLLKTLSRESASAVLGEIPPTFLATVFVKVMKGAADISSTQ
jgi:hypothetical protein